MFLARGVESELMDGSFDRVKAARVVGVDGVDSIDDGFEHGGLLVEKGLKVVGFDGLLWCVARWARSWSHVPGRCRDDGVVVVRSVMVRSVLELLEEEERVRVGVVVA